MDGVKNRKHGNNQVSPVPKGGQVELIDWEDEWGAPTQREPKSTSGVKVEIKSGKTSKKTGDAKEPKQQVKKLVDVQAYAKLAEKRKNRKEDKLKEFETNDLKNYFDKQINVRFTQPLTIRLRDRPSDSSGKPPKGWAGWKYRQKLNWKKTKLFWREVGLKLEVWGSSLKSIEGHQGTGVASYFVFLKWLFFLNIFLFVLMFLFVTLPSVIFAATDYTSSITGSTVYTASVNKSITCSALYTVTVSSAAQDVILDFLQGTGWAEKTEMFYGDYVSRELYIASIPDFSFVYNMPLAYLLVVFICLLISLIMMARKTVGTASNFRDTIISKDSKGHNFTNKVFGTWDFTLNDEKATKLKNKSIHYDIVSDLNEQRHAVKRETRTTGDKCKLFMIRLVINIFILACLGAAGYLIFYVTDFSATFTQVNTSGYDSFVVLLVQYAPSLTIAVLNAILPIMFSLIVKAEDYKPGFVIKITLVRTVFLRLASIAMIFATMYIQITCTEKDTCQVGTGSCSTFTCWETYVGQALYKLVLTDFFVILLVSLVYEPLRKLLTTKCKFKLLKKIGPAEFDIPVEVLDLVYTQTLCWLGFFFAPLITAMTVLKLFLIFYLKLLSALFSTVPSERPYRASRSNTFFMVVLMLAFFLCCIPLGYTIVKIPPSTGCGPFRVHNSITDILYITYSSWPDWLFSIVDVIFSAAVAISIIILLVLIIYYCSSVAKANKEMVKMLKEQLINEGKDKQFLFARIQQLSGEGAPGQGKTTKSKSKPMPPAAQQLNTVDERSNRLKKSVVNGGAVLPTYDESNLDTRDDVPAPAAYSTTSPPPRVHVPAPSPLPDPAPISHDTMGANPAQHGQNTEFGGDWGRTSNSGYNVTPQNQNPESDW